MKKGGAGGGGGGRLLMGVIREEKGKPVEGVAIVK